MRNDTARRRTFLSLMLPTLLLGLGGASVLANHPERRPGQASEHEDEPHLEQMRRFSDQTHVPEHLAAMSVTPCAGGFAGIYPCHNVELMSLVPLASMGGGTAADMWGWSDSLTGKKIAIVGRSTGTSFVDITDPANPVYLGNLPPHTSNSLWRDVEVYNNHAFIISEASGHGMQVFDLRQLRNVTSPPVVFSETAHYAGFGNCHTIAINTDTGFAYAVGTSTCGGGGPHIVNVQNPASPVFAGCVSSDGYTHETQCVIYHGPNAAHQGREICFSSNEDTLTLVDVTNKSAPVQISRTGYPGRGYTHQGWLTDDHTYFLLDDELDESNFAHATRTRIWNVSNLEAPVILGIHDGRTMAIDHNQYVFQGHVYQANYRAGLSVLDVSDVAAGSLSEVAWFDIYPASDSANFNGAWGNYPFFGDGIVCVSGIEQGLFVLRVLLAPDFSIDAADAVLEVCDPGSDSTTVDVTATNGYGGLVTLNGVNLPSGVGTMFAPNPVSAPGTSELTVSTAGLPAGSQPVTVQGSDGTLVHSRTLSVNVATAIPDPPVPVSPPQGATDLPAQPVLSWNPAPQAFGYSLEVATDPAFGNIVYATPVSGTSQQVGIALAWDTQHYWRVTASNPCGPSPASATFSFRTAQHQAVLLVDGDDNSPDVRAAYTAALTALGQDYDVWDVSASGEPSAAALAPYSVALWMTGDARGGSAGPSAAAEATLGPWLDGVGCLLVASQDYLFDRGLTPFAQGRLGVGSYVNDVGQIVVKGRPPVFAGLGPYNVILPYTNRTDSLSPATATLAAFTGSSGFAALERDGGLYRTSLWSFGLEGLPAAADRQAVLSAFLDWCGDLAQADGDSDGTPNGADCAPATPTLWSAPSPARDLLLSRDTADNLTWTPPAQPGAASVIYDVLRSSQPSDFLAATCVESGGADTGATDVSLPPVDSLYSYLIRARNGCGQNLGSSSAGVPRTGADCP